LNTLRSEDAFDEISLGLRTAPVHFFDLCRQTYLDESNVFVHCGIRRSQCDRNDKQAHESDQKKQLLRALRPFFAL
jgi:hypothetical protein